VTRDWRIRVSVYPCIRVSVYPCIRISVYLCIRISVDWDCHLSVGFQWVSVVPDPLRIFSHGAAAQPQRAEGVGGVLSAARPGPGPGLLPPGPAAAHPAAALRCLRHHSLSHTFLFASCVHDHWHSHLYGRGDCIIPKPIPARISQSDNAT
jgi:hypothetical protein